MSVARRPLLTATAAGTLLCALWFVPSANATAEKQAQEHRSGGSTAATATNHTATQGEQELLLAQTGSMNTTPYLITGTAFLGIGAGFVAYSVRRRTALPAAF
ncbi:LPXTG cell wall anchor domain-containing protein [Streptomyces sp. NPDC002889]|uniref:LPXTG cell wall anchor domain-containing protein n=1 Tax=Streptomyces sp. NPDC002889 TaxID=3364669 RepID=UPI0036B307AF